MKNIYALLIVLLLCNFASAIDSDDYINYAINKVKNTTIKIYDIEFTVIVKEKALNEEQIEKNTKNMLVRQNVDEEDPKYTEMYTYYFDLFKNKFNGRIYKKRISVNDDYLLFSEAQYFDSNKLNDQKIEYFKTELYDFNSENKYRIFNPSKTIHQSYEKAQNVDLIIDKMLTPENLLLPAIKEHEKDNTKGVFITINRDEAKKEELLRFIVNDNFYYEYNICEKYNQPLIKNVKSVSNGHIWNEISFDDYAIDETTGVIFAKKSENSIYSFDGKFERSENYVIEKYEFNKINEKLSSIINQKQGYQYFEKKDQKFILVGKIGENGPFEE
jgi:hypothetical protein